MKALLTILSVLFISTSNSQTLIRWDFENLGLLNYTPTYQHPNLSALDLRLSEVYLSADNGTVGVSGNMLDRAVISRSWPIFYDWDWADFYEFSIDADPGVAFLVDSISLWHKKNLVGPKILHFRFDGDDFSSVIDSSLFLVEQDVSWHRWSFAFEHQPFVSVDFRLYGNGAVSVNSGTLAIDSVAIFGSVVYADTLHLRAMLSGPFDESTGMMHDSLRSKGLVPLVDPYGYGKTISQSVLDVSGANGVVDWVNVGIRSSSNPSVVLDSFPALIQRDGDIVGLGGVGPPTVFASEDSSYISVQHRNHLGVMTSVPVSLSDTVNFHLFSTSVFGVDARKQVGSSALMWDGDVNHDNSIRYVGQSNDRDFILQGVGGTVPTNAVSGYFDFDVNMDGIVRYTGQDNDRDPILLNIGGSVPTNTKVGSVP